MQGVMQGAKLAGKNAQQNEGGLCVRVVSVLTDDRRSAEIERRSTGQWLLKGCDDGILDRTALRHRSC